MRKRFGDRRDGKRVKVDGLHQLLIDLKPRRCDSDVYINQKVDVTNLVKYIEKKKKDNPDMRITYFHAFAMAFAKLFYNRELLNRFICDRKTYRRNDVIIAFTAKIAFEDYSEEVMINLKIDADDTLDTVSKKVYARVKKLRNSKQTDKKENTNNAVDVIGHMPGIIRIPLVGFIKWLDKKGWIPASLVEDNLYYSTAILSNLGNFGIGSIYHNLTNFGTSSMLATIGKIHKETIVDENGKTKVMDVCDFGVNMDERIADGYYFAKSLKMFEYIINNPELLEERADAKIDYEE